MAHKSFISFKTEDFEYKEAILKLPGIDIIDKSLDEPIDSEDEDYIMRKIREDYLEDSTVTIHLIGSKSAEAYGWDEQKYIKRELQASLYNGENNTRNGILGVVLPTVHDQIFKGQVTCARCGSSASCILLNDDTAVAEFHRNYYIDPDKCHYEEDDRYCILVGWDDFKLDPNKYIEQAYAKREHPIAGEATVRP